MKLKLKGYQVQFLEDGHTYTLGGDLLTGVTTILGVRNKDFLKWWTVKLMYETLLPKLKDVQGIGEKEWEAILLEAKKAHTIKSKEALDSGKIAHEWIEQYVGARIDGKALYNEPIADEKAQNAVNQFLEWEKAHKVEWLASELVLAHPGHKFAGTVDAVARVDGVLSVLDWKTSNQISEEYFLQTAAYMFLLDENLIDGEERPTQRIIVRIPKDGKEFEIKVVDTPYEFDVSTFLHLRECHRWNVFIENNKK